MTVELPFRIEVRREDQAVVLAPSGELDLASAPELEAELERAWESQVELVIVDLRNVGFMDSTGVHVLVAAHQRAERDSRRFAVVEGSEQVHKVLSVTQLLETLTVVPAPEVLLR